MIPLMFLSVITVLNGNCGFNPFCWAFGSGYDKTSFIDGLNVWFAEMSGNESNVINAFMRIRSQKSLELRQLASYLQDNNSNYSEDNVLNAINETWSEIPSVDSQIFKISEFNYTQSVNNDILNATSFLDVENQEDIETLENVSKIVNGTPAYNVIQNVIQMQETHKNYIESKLNSNNNTPIITPIGLNSTELNTVISQQVEDYDNGMPANQTITPVISQYSMRINTTYLNNLKVPGITINHIQNQWKTFFFKKPSINHALLTFKCERCEREWITRTEEAQIVCSKCKSHYWDKPLHDKKQW